MQYTEQKRRYILTTLSLSGLLTSTKSQRIIEKALLEYYKDEIEEFRKSKEEKQQ